MRENRKRTVWPDGVPFFLIVYPVVHIFGCLKLAAYVPWQTVTISIDGKILED